MTEPALDSKPPTPLIISGVLFMIGWIGLHVAWGWLALIANLMANDAGRASANQQMVLIFGMLAGQIIAGAAGIPAGLAFFWRGRRKLLLILFGVLFVIGVACQALIFYGFAKVAFI